MSGLSLSDTTDNHSDSGSAGLAAAIVRVTLLA